VIGWWWSKVRPVLLLLLPNTARELIPLLLVCRVLGGRKGEHSRS
jgi:hypothetical protein